jgi:hypothetical protein
MRRLGRHEAERRRSCAPRTGGQSVWCGWQRSLRMSERRHGRAWRTPSCAGTPLAPRRGRDTTPERVANMFLTTRSGLP